MKRYACLCFILITHAEAQVSSCGDWAAWTPCSETCGIGIQTRVFHSTLTGEHPECPYQEGMMQAQQCQMQNCPSLPPAVFVSSSPDVTDSWCQTVCKPDSQGTLPSACIPNPTSPLDQKCASAGVIPRRPTGAGAPPPAQPESATQQAPPPAQQPQPQSDIMQYIPQDIPVKFLSITDCIGEWTQWSSCTQQCGGGQQTQTFQISVPASPLGRRCQYQHGQTQTRTCNEEPCTETSSVTQQVSQSVTQESKPCHSIAPEVSDWWCLKNCIADSTGNLPPACKSQPVTPFFQKCACDAVGEKFGCWSVSPSVPEFWCSMVCTTMDAFGDVHAACKPGPFQECQCRFRSLPSDLRPPQPLQPTPPATQPTQGQPGSGTSGSVQAPEQPTQGQPESGMSGAGQSPGQSNSGPAPGQQTQT